MPRHDDDVTLLLDTLAFVAVYALPIRRCLIAAAGVMPCRSQQLLCANIRY